MWVWARIFLGHGFPYCLVAGAALIGELAHPKERARLGALFNSFYYVGALIAAGIVMKTLDIQSDWSWRLPSILQLSPSLFQLVFIFFIPESPRWLVSKDRGDEALAILIKYHAEGDESAVLPRMEYAQIKRALDIENETHQKSWLQLFESPGMRRRSLIAAALGIFTQFSGNTLISAYLVKILRDIGYTDPRVQNKINVGLQAWCLIQIVILALITPRFPRRRMYLLCTCCLLCVYTAWTIAQARQMITGSHGAGIAVITFIFLYQPAYSIAFSSLTYTYLIELFPFYARAKGLAWFQLFSKSIGFFSTFVNPIALDSITWKYLIVFICWIAFEIVFVYFLFPETHNRTLEELAFRKSRPNYPADLFPSIHFDANTPFAFLQFLKVRKKRMPLSKKLRSKWPSITSRSWAKKGAPRLDKCTECQSNSIILWYFGGRETVLCNLVAIFHSCNSGMNTRRAPIYHKAFGP